MSFHAVQQAENNPLIKRKYSVKKQPRKLQRNEEKMGNEKKKVEMKCSETKEKEGGVEGPKRKTDGKSKQKRRK